ncbi:MAG: hypothetical protein AAB352_00135 [Patescibacteria group bacterium]
MKLPLTEQFLWDIYHIMREAGDTLDSMYKPITFANYLPGPKNPVFEKYRKNKGEREFSKFISYLKRKNYIKVENLKEKKTIILTKEGIGKALKASFIMEGIKKRKDGKWIMLTFDMPAKNKRARDLMRSILHDLGYKIFQHSVWITPYDVYKKTEELLQFYSLDKYVKIFLIEKI